HRGPGSRCLRTLMACLLLSLIAVPDGLAGEWENMRESYDNTLRAHAKRIAEIEARERGVPVDPEKRAEKITRDRITGIKGSLKGGGKARSLADAAERASGDARAVIDVDREQGAYLDIVMSEWRAEGAERRKLRESIAALRKSLERANADLATAIEVAETTTMRVPQSGVLEKVARIEAEAKERARWQHERAARERERQQREREAAERERGVR
ncbi:MAG TPA: hypothetical protein VNQ15_07375, partial [Verrucomicrobiae bacterium]|nr:hypothetical protein [Verrucomicrobiae bacterium]